MELSLSEPLSGLPELLSNLLRRIAKMLSADRLSSLLSWLLRRLLSLLLFLTRGLRVMGLDLLRLRLLLFIVLVLLGSSRKFFKAMGGFERELLLLLLEPIMRRELYGLLILPLGPLFTP